MAAQYGYDVIGVETRKELVEKVNEKNKKQTNFKMITYNITKEMQSRELESLLFPSAEPSDYGIIGLHCCGDLSPSMCRLFIESQSHCCCALWDAATTCCLRRRMQSPINSVIL